MENSNVNTTKNSNPLMDFAFGFTIFFHASVLFRSPFEFYTYYLVFLSLYPFLLFKYGISKKVVLVLLVLFLVGIFHVAIGNNKIFDFIKVWGGMVLAYSSYDMFLSYYNHDIVYIFRIYFKGCMLLVYVAIAQFVGFYILHLSFLYDYSWLLNKWGVIQSLGTIRINSFVPEPSSLVMILAPLLFVVIYSFLDRKIKLPLNISLYQKIAIIFAYFSSLSSSGYIGIMIIFMLFLINFANFKYILIAAVCIPLLIYGVSQYDAGFLDRFTSLQKIFSSSKVEDFVNKKIGAVDPELNGSSFVLADGIQTAFQNVRAHPLTGTGLGSFMYAAKRYSFFRFLNKEAYKSVDNSKDGNSQFARIMGEGGILGLGLWIFMMFKCFIRRPKKALEGEEYPHWLYANAFLVIILLYFIRQGNYFATGFPLFVLAYISNFRDYRKYKTNVE